MKRPQMIANGTTLIEELGERAKLVIDGLNACSKTLLFPLGVDELNCYDYTDRAGKYQSWGTVSRSGIFTCWCNWGGNHQLGQVDLTNPTEVFVAFENSELADDLKRFLKEQIQKAQK